MTRAALAKKQQKKAKSGSVHMVGMDKYEPAAIPEAGKTYYAYDDGKIRISREEKHTVEKIVPYEEAPAELIAAWEEEVISTYWLFYPLNDYFVLTRDEQGDESWFVRTKDGGWFSISWANSEYSFLKGARLDITGKLYRIAHEGELNNGGFLD